MPAAALLTEFTDELDLLRGTRAKAIALQASAHLDTPDLDYIIEALALHLCASLDAFLNDLFLQVLSSTSGLASVSSHLAVTDEAKAREILYGDSDSLDWLPVSRVVNRANRLLECGQPFTRLRFRKLEPIENLRIARNRIAHHGEKAREAYESRIVRGDINFRRPARWLTHTRPGTATDNLTQAIDVIAAVAECLATDAPDLDSLLGPAFLIDDGSSVPAGTYRCAQCGTQVVTTTESKIEPCTTCVAMTGSAGKKWELTALTAP